MLPMGTIMTLCMILGVAFAGIAPMLRRDPTALGAESLDARGGGGAAGDGTALGTRAEPSAATLPRPGLASRIAGTVVALGGLWNVGWYGLRHAGEFWGQAALVSGLLMLVVAGYLLAPRRLPVVLLHLRPLVVVALAACAILYGVTIYRL